MSLTTQGQSKKEAEQECAVPCRRMDLDKTVQDPGVTAEPGTDVDLITQEIYSRNGGAANRMRPEKRCEKATDEDDGLMKVLSKLTCGSKGMLKDKDNLEPYIKDPKAWTNSKYATGSSEEENATKELTNEQTNRFRQPSKLIQNSTEAAENEESDIYDFSHQQRGYFLLVINKEFVRQDSRRGADIDLLKMTAVAKKLGFQFLNDTPESKMNLSKNETLNWLRKAQSMDHSCCDCFMFMISTHGLEQPNPRKGGQIDHALVCADDELIFTSTIMEMFNETNCPTLKGKPKIFIIQACRGTGFDHGDEVKVESDKEKTDIPNKGRPMADHLIQQNLDKPDTKAGQDSWDSDRSSNTETTLLQCDADMLVMYAVPPGKAAWRNESDGSWMVHYLHEVLMSTETEGPRNFLHVLTEVSARMSRRATDVPEFPNMHGKKAVPVIEHKLTKTILF